MTRGVPSIVTRSSATTRAMLLCKGDAQRLNSSCATWFGPVLRTIWGTSTTAGTDTGPTATLTLQGACAAAVAGAGGKVYRWDAGLIHPPTNAAIRNAAALEAMRRIKGSPVVSC